MEGGWKDRLDASRLVKVIARKREECGRISWWGEYDQLLRKYGLDDNERGSAQRRTLEIFLDRNTIGSEKNIHRSVLA